MVAPGDKVLLFGKVVTVVSLHRKGKYAYVEGDYTGYRRVADMTKVEG